MVGVIEVAESKFALAIDAARGTEQTWFSALDYPF